MSKHLVLQIISLIFILSACTNSINSSLYSRKYHVYFTFDCTIPPYNLVGSAGQFLAIEQVGGYLRITNSDNQTISQPISEKEDRAFVMGLSGLIVGTPILNNDSFALYAFDLGCPICDVATHSLTLDNLGVATCNHCKSSWDLNNNGFIRTFDSKKYQPLPLYRYPVVRQGNIYIITN